MSRHKPILTCPNCRCNFDQRRQQSGPPGPPETNDLCVCGYCGEILIYRKDRWNKMSDEDILGVDPITLGRLRQAKLNMVRAVTMLERDDTPDLKG